MGVVRSRDGVDARRLRDQLHSHVDIEFVRDMSDLEMHGDGVVVWPPQYRIDIPQSIPERWQSRYLDRSRSRYERRNMSGAVMQIVDWRFYRRPENIVELCERAVVELKKFIDDFGIEAKSSARVHGTIGV